MNHHSWLYMIALLTLMTGCTAYDTSGSDNSFIGQPIDIRLSVDGTAGTRAVTALTSGTAWLNGGSSDMKPYTYNAGSYTSTDPLVWTGTNMTITGYYADGGQTAVASGLAYTINYGSENSGSFLAGETTASYANRTPVSIVLRQQLAQVSVTVRTEGGSTATNPQLRNIYTSGTFGQDFDSNGYATGGTNGSGWTVSGSTSTIGMSPTASPGIYQAAIIPQTITAGTTIFTIEVDGLMASFELASVTTFKAGCRYNLEIDEISHTLYLESEITIKDFDSGISASESDVQAK